MSQREAMPRRLTLHTASCCNPVELFFCSDCKTRSTNVKWVCRKRQGWEEFQTYATNQRVAGKPDAWLSAAGRRWWWWWWLAISQSREASCISLGGNRRRFHSGPSARWLRPCGQDGRLPPTDNNNQPLKYIDVYICTGPLPLWTSL